MRGVIKAKTFDDVIFYGAERGLSVFPIKQPDKWRDEWYFNFAPNIGVEEICRWYNETTERRDGGYVHGTLLFYSEGEYSHV
jgi:hypothetical protein